MCVLSLSLSFGTLSPTLRSVFCTDARVKDNNNKLKNKAVVFTLCVCYGVEDDEIT